MTDAPGRAQPPARRDPEPPIFGLLRQMGTQISAALPRHLTPERFARMCFTTLRTTPKLAQCDLRSVLAAIMEFAQLGIEPGTPLGHGWIIPFGKFAQVIVGYKGFVQLAYRSDVIIVAETVYTKDEFSYQPSNVKEPIFHRYSDDDDRGELRYSYSLAQFPNGRLSYRLCTLADIRKAQKYSQAYQRDLRKPEAERDSIWWEHPDPQWRKTAIRRHSSVLPLNTEFVRAADLDDTSSRGEIQIFDLTPDDAKQEIIADAIGASLEDVRRELQEPTPPEAGTPSKEPQKAAAPTNADKLFGDKGKDGRK